MSEGPIFSTMRLKELTFMGMNSWSFKKFLTVGHDLSEKEIDELTNTHFRLLNEEPKAEPIDMEKLKTQYKDTSQEGRRVAPRVPIEMTVIVYSQTKSHRTKSVNVSLTGVLLGSGIPDGFSSGAVEVVFIHEDPKTGKKKHLVFIAEVVDAKNGGKRLQFKTALEKSSEELEKILNGAKLKSE